ncbi:YqgQ family protein [Bacillus taeanensis]|uniref:YqgQ family protein n=1 Tax=Bacillus taeanensis TaxID=273032 RepID=UPI001FEABA28|nr:YqgQ family protein [Bacillus taeanensis]
MKSVKTVFDIQQVLKGFGTIIYTGNRLADLELMEEELRELFQTKLIDVKVFQQALLLLKSEQEKEKRKNN